MARDRKRAKQRRDRASRAGKDSGSLARSQPIRTEVPPSLEHIGSEDEFDAAIVQGGDGVPVPEDEVVAAEQAAENEPVAEADKRVAETEKREDVLQEPGGDGAAGRVEERPSGAPVRSGNRVIGFLRASWAELQRVQWPDRRQVAQATAVVLGFVAVAGAYLGLADFVAKEIVEYIL
jgi:preprotein translocase SecE subunit